MSSQHAARQLQPRWVVSDTDQAPWLLNRKLTTSAISKLSQRNSATEDNWSKPDTIEDFLSSFGLRIPEVEKISEQVRLLSTSFSIRSLPCMADDLTENDRTAEPIQNSPGFGFCVLGSMERYLCNKTQRRLKITCIRLVFDDYPTLVTLRAG